MRISYTGAKCAVTEVEYMASGADASIDIVRW